MSAIHARRYCHNLPESQAFLARCWTVSSTVVISGVLTSSRIAGASDGRGVHAESSRNVQRRSTLCSCPCRGGTSRARVTMSPAPSLAADEFVGRRSALTVLEELIGTLEAGGSGMACVTGPLGVG